MQDIKELTLEGLKDILGSWNKPSFHARQIFSWVYQKRAENFDQMSNLPFDLRAKLKEEFYLSGLRVIKVLKSGDGTEKQLFELKDGNFIEAVIIPAQKRLTGCLSSQAGCKFACRFCASGLLGFKRNLTSGEILDEISYLERNSRDKKLTHIVFMGVGEPLDNYDNVLKAVRIINSSEAFNIAARRITISTSGVIPGFSIPISLAKRARK
ncbi:MAG: radical SAM protein, partial [Candidatus Omnitrophota bacterium]